jgi:hypothetical protein
MVINKNLDAIVFEKDQETFELIKKILNENKIAKVHQITAIGQATQPLLSIQSLKYFFCGYEIGSYQEEKTESLARELLAKQRGDVKYIPYPYLRRSDLLLSARKILIVNKTEFINQLVALDANLVT